MRLFNIISVELGGSMANEEKINHNCSSPGCIDNCGGISIQVGIGLQH